MRLVLLQGLSRLLLHATARALPATKASVVIVVPTIARPVATDHIWTEGIERA